MVILMVYYDVQNSEKTGWAWIYNTIKRDETIFYPGKLQVTIILDRLLQRIFIINYNLCRLTHVKNIQGCRAVSFYLQPESFKNFW